MRILVLNADYPRFLAWFYRRQAGLESPSYATQMAARNASLFGVADFYSKTSPRWATPRRRFTSTIHGSRPLGHAKHGMAFEAPEPPALSAARRLQPRLYRR